MIAYDRDSFISLSGTMEKILFFDIETVGCVAHYDELSPTMQTLRDKKCSHMKEIESYSSAELFEKKAGIFAEFGKIICISCGYRSDQQQSFITKSYSGDDEKSILTEFIAMLDQLSNYILCGHNSKEFDIPYVCRRAVIHGITLPSLLNLQNKKPREVQHKDTMEMWSFGDRKNFTSLWLLCEILQVPSSKDDIDWSQIHHTYRHEHNIERITTYCAKDVVATAEVYKKLSNIHF